MAGKLSEKGIRLECQLPGRRQNQREDTALRFLEESLEDWEKEGGGLPGARLGGPNDIPARDGVRDGALLNGCRNPVPDLSDPSLELGMEWKVFERGSLARTVRGRRFVGGLRHVLLAAGRRSSRP
jgi:hypothetical protein